MIAIPTSEQLAPLYAAAKRYGKASVRKSEIYVKSKRKKTPELDNASRVADRAYRTMTARLDALNAQFPGLELFCPAPFVGWTGELDTYTAYVERHLPDYATDQWRKLHKREFDAIREALRALPATEDYAPGDYVFDDRFIYQIERITPKRRKVTAVVMPNRERPDREPSGPMKRLDKALTDRMLRLYRSRERALKRLGLEEKPDPRN